MKSWTIGVDLGGTKMLAALVDPTGKIHHQATRPVTPPSSPELDPRDPYQPSKAEVQKHIKYVVDSMAEIVAECASKKKVGGIGLASAGPMDLERGLLIDCSNWKGWKRVAIIDKLTQALSKRGIKSKVHFQNDAVAAALGEGWVGVAKEKSTYAMITIGTGIGTGVILNGQPAQSRGAGCEWGHLILDTRGFSKRLDDVDSGSPDAQASGTGLVKQAHKRGYTEFKTAREICEASAAGDKRASELLLQASEALASLFYSLSLGFNPDVFAVSGGMLAMQEHFLPQAIDMYKKAIRVKYPAFETPIKIAKVGSNAGVIGAARLPSL